MGQIERYESGDLARSWPDRRTGRALSRLDAGTRLAVARVDQVAEVQASKVQAVAEVGARGLQAVALVTQLEQNLATQVPLATSRLQAIADMTALNIAQIVSDTVWRLK